MRNTINTGGSAFPSTLQYFPKDTNYEDQPGMTLRDYFAAHALTGAQIWDAVLNGKHSKLASDGTDLLAQIAYAVADSMLKARATDAPPKI